MLLTMRTALLARALQLVDLFKNYFEGEFNEASVRNNFVLMWVWALGYELRVCSSSAEQLRQGG